MGSEAVKLCNNDYDTTEDVSDDEIITENTQEHKKSERKRKARIVLIILIIMMIILILCSGWLIYNHNASSVTEDYEDISCESSDLSCLEMLCPQGTQYSAGIDQCLVQEDYSCCTGQGDIFSCGPTNTITCVEVAYEGVLYPGYKQYCREGWLWVPWKRKCMRKKTGIVDWGEAE